MDGISIRDAKGQRLGREGDEAERAYRLDDLPDEILLHILSFLPTKCLTKASLVSKKWMNLCSFVPNLRFEEPSWDESRRDMFLYFVEGVLRLYCSSKINEFSLDCYVDVDTDDVSSWIDYAVSRNVQVMKLKLWSVYDDHNILPPSLFSSKSLTKLEIQMFANLVPFHTVHFSSLKFMKLEGVSFSDYQLASQLFSNCPVLEELEFHECRWNSVGSVHISAPSLVRLSIFDATDADSDDEDDCQVLISGPNLKSFDYGGECKIQYCFLDSSSLKDACINVCCLNMTKDDGLESKVANRTHKLLKGLYNVNYLVISNKTLQILDHARESFSKLPLFANLTCLRLTNDPVNFYCPGLLHVLDKSPSLECLESLEGMVALPPNGSGNLPFPKCFQTSLKTVTVFKFAGKEEERFGVMSFLVVVKALERLCLPCLGSEEDLDEFFSYLSKFSFKSISALCIHEPTEEGGTRAVHFADFL